MSSTKYNEKTGLPEDETYLEKGLPPYLLTSLEAMKKSWAIEDAGKRDLHWDLYWCELNADIIQRKSIRRFPGGRPNTCAENILE